LIYDANNIFAKILRGEIPCKKVYEDEYALSFHDIRPLAPVHVLVIPKGPYVTLDDLSTNAPTEFVGGFFRAVAETARVLGVVERGYRILANIGRDGHQEVMHFHIHIFAGRPLGRMLSRNESSGHS
jgi:diadenosine tetraphosphate (Ap4A) HIT family hydrolase